MHPNQRRAPVYAGFQAPPCAKTPVQYRNEVRKRSAKAKCQIELVYNKVIYSISYIWAGVKRNLQKFAFFGVNSSEARWFRVPPPEIKCAFLKINRISC